MTGVLYVTRTGLLEPLGQSQVLPYLRGLATDYRIILITCEKTSDWSDGLAMARVADECRRYGIDWRPRIFRSRPRILGPGRDLLAVLRDAISAVQREGVQLIHARSYLPAAIAWIVHKAKGTPFVFDMRALWPEERITAGQIRRGSLLHRAITAMEVVCLRDSAAVVSLTKAAAEHLHARTDSVLAGKHIAVIPTCADLSRFTPPQERIAGPPVHGCIGTVTSGWFRGDWLAAWFAALAHANSDALFEIVSRDDHARVRAAVDPGAILGDRLKISARTPTEMPDAIRKHATSAMFFTGGLSKLGSAPTRMAEVLATGIPVIANEGVGDVARILRQHRVGVIASGSDNASMAAACAELGTLLQDPHLAARCRKTASDVFSLESGTEAYREIYRSIIPAQADAPGNKG